VDDELDRRDDRELDLIRGQMDRTREALGEKLEALESQVMGTVQTATEGVATAVEGVKSTVETVSETVANVTETFNISRHVENHPFASVGCSFGCGMALGLLTGGDSEAPAHQQAFTPPQPAPPTPPPPRPVARREEPHKEEDESSGIISTAFTGLAALGVNALGGVLRNLIHGHLPKDMQEPLHGIVQKIVDGLGLPAGANPIPPPGFQPEPQPDHGGGHAAETRHDQGPEGRRSDEEETRPKPQTRPQPHEGGRALAGRR